MILRYMIADASDAVGLFKIIFFIAFIVVWMAVRSHAKDKVKKLTDPNNRAESLLQSVCKDMEEELAKLRGDLSAKEDRLRSGSSPLKSSTIEERKRALNDVLRAFENAKGTGALSDRANRLQDMLPSYITLSIDIKMDTVEELEAFLKAAEAVQIQKGTKTTEGSISDLCDHTTAARTALEAARKTTDPKVATNLVATADNSLKAGLAVVSALQLIGNL